MSDAVAVKKFAKPELRGLSRTYMRNHGIVAAVLCTVGVLAFKFGIVDRRRSHYANFYRTYDIDKEFERMRKAGVFQSVSKD